MAREADVAARTNSAPQSISVQWSVIEAIYQTIGRRPAESGGVLGASVAAGAIDQFVFDESSENTQVTYTPNHLELNRIFDEEWGPKAIRLKGFVHSHPRGFTRPSGGDLIYAARILAGIEDLGSLFLPIIQTIPDRGIFALHPWVATSDRGCRLLAAQLMVTGDDCDMLRHVPVEFRRRIEKGLSVDCLEINTRQKPITISAPQVAKVIKLPRREEIFDRVRAAYDLSRMRDSRLVIVGAGGAAEWVESMARAGVEQIVLIDPDTVDTPNIATQQTYLKDIGRSKVECIAERIRDINPHATVTTYQLCLDDIDDAAFKELSLDRLGGRRPSQTLLCGFTDSFEAQARVNRLGLNLGLPTLSAQVYQEGRGAELSFTYPGVTPACQRCVTGGRYRHIRAHGQQDAITSHGTPIFSTSRLNATKGLIAMAMLHHGSAHQRWGGLLARIGNRNLVQIRLDPDLGETLGLTVFDDLTRNAEKNRLLFDDIVWLEQEPECPATGFDACQDCGGTGNLLDARGSFSSTQIPIWVEPETEAESSLPDVPSASEQVPSHSDPEAQPESETPPFIQPEPDHEAVC